MDEIKAEWGRVNQDVMRSVMRDRSTQFVGRLGWDLCLNPDGLEIDEYDAPETTYMVIHEQSRHVGSCRVRPVRAGSMLVDHFLDSFPEAVSFLAGQERSFFELTRFCRSPSARSDQIREMLGRLANMLDSFRSDSGISGYLAVVYPEVGRYLSRIGVRFIRISTSEICGRAAHLICITDCQDVERVHKAGRIEAYSKTASFPAHTLPRRHERFAA
jgi:N-acyl-L-homoserine lactone synthetase